MQLSNSPKGNLTEHTGFNPQNQEHRFPTRMATVSRTTGETDVQVSLNLDGTGACTAATGIPFLDHMLHQISSHGLIDLAAVGREPLAQLRNRRLR